MSGFACPKCKDVVDIFGSGAGEKLAKETGVPYLGAIPLDPDVARAGDLGKVFMESGDDQPTVKAMNEIVSKL